MAQWPNALSMAVCAAKGCLTRIPIDHRRAGPAYCFECGLQRAETQRSCVTSIAPVANEAAPAQ